MPPLTLELVGLIFSVGVFYAAVRGSLNSVAAKAAELERRTQANHLRTTLIVLAICPEKKRDQLISWMLQGIFGD